MLYFPGRPYGCELKRTENCKATRATARLARRATTPARLDQTPGGLFVYLADLPGKKIPPADSVGEPRAFPKPAIVGGA